MTASLPQRWPIGHVGIVSWRHLVVKQNKGLWKVPPTYLCQGVDQSGWILICPSLCTDWIQGEPIKWPKKMTPSRKERHALDVHNRHMQRDPRVLGSPGHNHPSDWSAKAWKTKPRHKHPVHQQRHMSLGSIRKIEFRWQNSIKLRERLLIFNYEFCNLKTRKPQKLNIGC